MKLIFELMGIIGGIVFFDFSVKKFSPPKTALWLKALQERCLSCFRFLCWQETPHWPANFSSQIPI